MFLLTFVAPIVVFLTALVLHVYCDDGITFSRATNTLDPNQWPALGSKRNVTRYQSNIQQTHPWPPQNNRNTYNSDNSLRTYDSNLRYSSNRNAQTFNSATRPPWNYNNPSRFENNQPSWNSGGNIRARLPSAGPVSPNHQQNGNGNRIVADKRDGGNSNGNINVEDYELREFSEALLGRDVNNAARDITVEFQQKTTSRSQKDEAPQPLLSIPSKVYQKPTIEKLMKLHDNYIVPANVNEHYTSEEKTEENNFLDAVLETSVMQYTRNFLIQKGRISKDSTEFKNILRDIWFNMYSRSGGKIGSSGFEHVFLAELKNSDVSGLHNWLYFAEEESKNQANYLGYMKKLDLGDKGAILKFHFTFHGVDKPVGSMFIGTSPELEMALYSTCFLLRANRVCPLKLNGHRFIIRTFTYNYRGKQLIGSAFPEI